jgi:formylglycine-generating enzyme required for sulfatase activity/dienelactone hydrolase
MDLRERLQHSLGPGYTLGRELGGGGMSRVFLAEDLRLGRTIVVKVLAPDLAAGISAERFEREIRVAASLQQANIVPLLTAGESEGLPYFTMPYVDGQSLRARLAAGARLSPVECLGILRDVTRALAHAHAHGVVHRDIKPDNVLLSGGAAVVTDFGIAKAISAARVAAPGETLTQLGTSVGTPAYMSPEQAAGDPDLDHRTDVYAVGVLAYEMLEGRLPFLGSPQAMMAGHISAPPPPLTPRDDVPSALARMVMRCLAKDPAARQQSAAELLAEIDAVATPSGTLRSASRPRPGRVLAWAGAAAALGAALWFGSAGMRQERWVKRDAIPRIRQHIELGQLDSAWRLARRAEEILPGDSVLATLWPRVARKGVMHSTPEGANVFRAAFDDTTSWVLLGVTPTDSIQLPIAMGRLRVEKPGYRPQLALSSGLGRTFMLDRLDAPDSDMVHVAGGTFGAFLVGLEGVKPLALGDYMMDRHEVTNRQYKAFVDAGGYAKPEYWPTSIVDQRQTLTWGAAIARFTDRTGRPGPASWEAGAYPSGQGDLPVGGVSWYEAAAYAKFAGKSLPTVFHWARAASIGAARFVVPGSNVQGTGPVHGSTTRGMSSFGVFDMAGNVREWCENEGEGGERFILGGGWSDPAYGFTDAYAQPPMDRSVINGIRLVRYLRDEPALAQARMPQARASRDYATEKPASDDAFQSFRHFYDYDRGPLNARVDARDTTQEDWIIERVSFDAAYAGERMMAVLFLPKHRAPPYQTVVYFPGSSALSLTSSAGVPREVALHGFVVKSGRAFVLPILKSTFERADSLHSDIADGSIFWRDHVVMWAKDIRRTVDYLATRADVDTTRLGYFGASWGSNQAPLSLALEPRFKAAVLLVGGLTMERGRPEADPLNFLPRVTVPVLMLNGKYDFFFPLERSQKHFFRLLGTPNADKKHLVYEGGHDVPRIAWVTESLAWFDRYLGPVR